MNDSLFHKIITKDGFKVFLCIVGFQYLYLCLKLGLNHGIEIFENLTDI